MSCPRDGRRRVVIEDVRPAVDGGRFPVKRVLGDTVVVEADAIADGHDQIACMLLHAHGDADTWLEVPMRALGNDTWRAAFTVHELGIHRFTVTAWIDAFASWRHAFARRSAPADVEDALRDGADLVRAAARARAAAPAARIAARNRGGARGLGAARRRGACARCRSSSPSSWRSTRTARSRRTTTASSRSSSSGRSRASRRGTSSSRAPRRREGAHGTFATAKARLAYVAEMGFDVLYLPPIHPIGATKRKGPNNALEAARGDPGSPWAIGGVEGGHKSVHPAARHARGFPGVSRGGASGSASRSRSTSRSSARPIIRTCASIRSGSSGGATAACSTRRTRRRNTRTSTRSISRATIGSRCGASCATSSSSG